VRTTHLLWYEISGFNPLIYQHIMTAFHTFRISAALVLSAASLLSGPTMRAATVNVRSAAAHDFGRSDDTAAINRAIARSSVGDTIFFPAGSYRITYPGIILEPGRKYSGDIPGESRLIGTGGYNVATTRHNLAVRLSLDHLVFEGGGLRLDGNTVPARFVSVTDCTFRNIVTDNDNWTTHMGIFIGPGAEHSHFDHNHFYNIFTGGKYPLDDRDATGIFGYGLSHTTITDNEFDFVNEGIHIFFDVTDGSDVLIARNQFTRVHRISMEFQHDHTDGLVIEDNVVSNPLNPYWLTYGISVAADTKTGHGIIVRNNTVVANTPLDLSIAPKNYYPYGLEVWGTNTVVSNNHVIGLWGIGIGIGSARNMLVDRNLICGKVTSYGKSINEYYGPQVGTRLNGNVIAPECPHEYSAMMALKAPRS
jgi:Right handed beta helix region